MPTGAFRDTARPVEDFICAADMTTTAEDHVQLNRDLTAANQLS